MQNGISLLIFTSGRSIKLKSHPRTPSSHDTKQILHKFRNRSNGVQPANFKIRKDTKVPLTLIRFLLSKEIKWSRIKENEKKRKNCKMLTMECYQMKSLDMNCSISFTEYCFLWLQYEDCGAAVRSNINF